MHALGLHRYIFLLFKQSGPIADKIRAGKTAQEMIAERKNHIKDFVEKHHLEGPIAGNFFQVLLYSCKKTGPL